MMGFDVNSQGSSATVDLPPSSRNPNLPPKPPTVSTPSVDTSKKPVAATSSVSSTPMSSGSGGYSLYSLIKKQSQSRPTAAAGKPVSSNITTSPAKSPAGSLPVGLLKKPSGAANLMAEQHPPYSAVSVTVSRNATFSRNIVSFATPVEKCTTVDENDYISSRKYVFYLSVVNPGMDMGLFFTTHPNFRFVDP